MPDKTIVYLDIPNVETWRPGTLNFQRFSSMLCGQIGSSLIATKAFAPDTSPEKLPQLSLQKDQGALIFMGDKILGSEPRRATNVDMHIASEMVNDFLAKKADLFLLCSDSRDYNPIVAVLKKLANKFERNMDIVHVTFRSTNIPGCAPLRVNDDFLRKASFAPESVSEYLEGHGDTRGASFISTRRTQVETEPGKNVGLILDLQSLGRSADIVRKDSAFTADLRGFVDALLPNVNIAQAHACFCVHSEIFNLRGHIEGVNLSKEAQTNLNAIVDTPNYNYAKVSSALFIDGPSSNIALKRLTPLGGKIASNVFAAAMDMAQRKDIDTIVLATDNPKLEPIIATLHALREMTGGKPMSIVHATLDPNARTFNGTTRLQAAKAYDEAPKVNRAQVAEIEAKDKERSDFKDLCAAIRAKVDKNLPELSLDEVSSRHTTYVTGIALGTSMISTLVLSSQNKYECYRTGDLPRNLQIGQTYDFTRLEHGDVDVGTPTKPRQVKLDLARDIGFSR